MTLPETNSTTQQTTHTSSGRKETPMKNSTLVSDIASRIGATSDDITALAPVWQNMMRRDSDGHLWISNDRQGYILGALDATADDRKDQRIKTADADLVTSYKQLMVTSRRGAPGLQGAARQQTLMLNRVNRVLDALTELVDAKTDARRIKPETAVEIHAEAGRLRRDARQNADQAIDAIRSLLALTA